MLRNIIVLCYLMIHQLIYGEVFISPCPKLFTYEPEGIIGDRWYGNINITADSEYPEFWLKLTFDKAILELGSDYGMIQKREANEYIIRRPRHKIKKHTIINVRIFARFDPEKHASKLLGFKLSGRTICPENGKIEDMTKSEIQLISPCPNVFEYESQGLENDRWYGRINYELTRRLTGPLFHIVLNEPSILLGNWFGDVTMLKNKREYFIRNRLQRYENHDTISFRFYVQFDPKQPTPKIKSIRLNKRSICNEKSSTNILKVARPLRPVKTTTTVKPQQFTTQLIPLSNPSTNKQEEDLDIILRQIFAPSETEEKLEDITEIQCGTVSARARPLITHGEIAEEGKWPWHVALYSPKGLELEYICGGSLISRNYILTAAHCVAKKTENEAIANTEIEIFLGKYHLRKFSSNGVQNIPVKSIILHPDYSYKTYKNDIAMMKLEKPARYTEIVRPICLWTENSDLSHIINRIGTVVGWGFDEKGKVTDVLRKTSMPVVSQSTCIWSYPEFFAKFASDKTFCAGNRNGTSVCNGDSGGGLVFPKVNNETKIPIWYVRGLVSISVALQSELVCDSSHYAVFTDVAKYTDWIKKVMIEN